VDRGCDVARAVDLEATEREEQVAASAGQAAKPMTTEMPVTTPRVAMASPAGAGARPNAAGTVANVATQPAAGSGGQAAPAGAGGAGAAGAVAEPTLEIRGDLHNFKLGRRSFIVDAAHGARITRFGLDDTNLLTGPEVDMLNYGSTFWPSPQDRWGWPPVPELDSEPYDFAEALFQFKSRPGMRAKVSVTKVVDSLIGEDTVEITYGLTNEDSAAASWAAWEITRVAAGGLSFFPTGERKVNTQLSVVDQGGISWFQHDPMKISGEGQKFTGDGAEGWLAHVAGRSLLIKKFVDVPADAQAPAPEAAIALYAARGYVEIEPQGPYTELMPGESLTWKVRWIVAELPAQLSAELGSQELVEFVRALVARVP
jgi:hypothetical protein